ncbi:MAG: hypothetical protein KAH32_05760, partial [Chlamydiia bacterium]|nr:hypothetical protein [Chlamydiia bacterium]
LRQNSRSLVNAGNNNNSRTTVSDYDDPNFLYGVVSDYKELINNYVPSLVTDKSDMYVGVMPESYSLSNHQKIFNFTPQTYFPTRTKPFNNVDLKMQGVYKVGDASLRITNLFGLRVGINKVRNRKGLSNGVDYVPSGDHAIAIDDGEIVRVHQQRSKKTGKDRTGVVAGGWIVTVKNKTTGLNTLYMHVDPVSAAKQKEMIGKSVKRGDKLTPLTAKWSGSGTGKHVKVTMYTGDYNRTRKYTDPSRFISGK